MAIIDSVGAHGSSFHFYLFGQAKGLIKNGVETSVYTNDETQDPKINSLKFYQAYKKLYKSKSKLIGGLRYLLGSTFAIFHARISGCSILHYHLFYTNILVLFNILLTRILFGKAVLTIHDVSSFSNDYESVFLSKLIYKFSNSIITHNMFSKTEIKKIKHLKSFDIHIIPHGNYLPFINVQENKLLCRDRLQISKNKKVIMFFGMIKKVKGLEVLLHALCEVKKNHNDVLLLIAGKSFKNDFTVYQKIIDQNNLQNHCMLHIRFIPDQDVEYYYGACDLVVLPYKRIYQSGVLLMSLSFEKATLVSNLPPLKEIITDGKNGFIFESENSIDLAKKLNDILSNKILLNKVGRNGRKLVEKKYNWEKIGRDTQKIYQGLIE